MPKERAPLPARRWGTNVQKSLFGKKLKPDEQVREWQANLRAQGRELDRQIRAIQQAEAKTKMEIKALAKKGDQASARILARELVRSRKAVDRIHTSKAQLNSVSMQLTNQLAIVRMSGSLQKSSEIMKMVNSLMKVGEIQAGMQTLAMEMTKAGVIEEMMDDALESGDADDVEEEADEEIDKVLTEITTEIGWPSPPAGITAATRVPLGKGKAPATQEPEEEETLEAGRALAAKYA